mmetsp:Transcript_8899/g.11341  ORF Transcript_8899/g.11341 Transcript_8899/m.11341 type:complete len:229 (-) Transcript_8899:575-1261(-)
MLQSILLIAAQLYALKEALRIVGTIYKFFLRPGKNLKKYGEWAMITGATDGIGKAIAHELASKGLSVVLISRTQSKLDAVQTEIKTKYPSVEVATIAIDYGCFDDAAKEKVAEFVKSNNVGILINNVGASYKFARPWHELDAAKVTELNELNVSSTVWMTHLLLPSMLGKKIGSNREYVLRGGTPGDTSACTVLRRKGIRPEPVVKSCVRGQGQGRRCAGSNPSLRDH